MPPKESKKTEIKKVQKVIEDRTFGLKNKNKSKTVQDYVKSVSTQVKQKLGVGSDAKRLEEEFANKAAKKKEEEKQAILGALFKSVKKVQAEGEESEEEEEEIINDEIDLYRDQREQIYGKEDEDMSLWDQAKLEKVALEQEKKYKNKNKTDKICKFFLDAVEGNKYGWRWMCPNGMDCMYKHCLPPGFVLKRDAAVIEMDTRLLEEKLEEERSKLKGGTPVTLERFLKWKEDKKKQREIEWEEKREVEAKKTGSKGFNALSGRALFKYDPTLFQDDNDALDEVDYEEEERKEGEEDEDEDGEGRYDDDDEGEGDEDENQNENNETNENGDNETQEGEIVDVTAGEAKKKKKKKKKAARNDDEDNVKINEDVFLGEEDVDLPEDDS